MKFFYIGDSIMEADGREFAYPDPSYNQEHIGERGVGYPSLLSLALGVENGKNIAVGGQGVAEQTALAIKEDFSGYDGVVITVGVNDFSKGTPIGELPDSFSGEFSDDFCGNYCRMLDHIFKSNPKIKVILMTPLHRDTMHREGNVPKNNVNTVIEGNRLVDFADAVIKIGALYSCTVADMYRESGLNRYNLPIYSFEGVHPTNEGYRFVFPTLLSAVKCAFGL